MVTEGMPLLQEQTSAYRFTPIDSGIDWLTCTARAGDEGRPFRMEGNAFIDERREADGDVKSASLRDYDGWSGDGWFIGKRSSDAIAVLRGRHAAPHWKRLARHASNVSRLDLQVTLWTHGEQPELARDEYDYLRSLPKPRGRPPTYNLNITHPYGETLYVGRRQSASFGRVYDYATAHKTGTPRTVFRFETQYGAPLAARHCRAILADPRGETGVANLVHAWFGLRRVRLPWSAGESQLSVDSSIYGARRDPLAWLRSSVSITVARAVERHGLQQVLIALGLSDKVAPIAKEASTDAPESEGPV